MSKKWRPPEGWLNTLSSPALRQAYEFGADDMYEPAYEKGRREEREALRKTGTHYKAGIHPPYRGVHPFAGTEVFIPDDLPDQTPQIQADRIVKIDAGGTLSTSVDGESRHADPFPYKIAGHFYNTPVKISGEVVEEGYFCVGCGQRIVPKIDQNHMCRDKKGISYQETWRDDGSSYWQTCRPRP